MGNWSYNPTYRSYNSIYNWKGAHLVYTTHTTSRKSCWQPVIKIARKSSQDSMLWGNSGRC